MTEQIIVAIRGPARALQLQADELGYLRGSWAEAYKMAPKMGKLPWSAYKRIVVPELERVLSAPDTELYIADMRGSIVGWLALARGVRVDTIHWLHTRYRIGADGELLRRRGVMTQLLTAANTKRRIAYTFRGPEPRGRDRHVSRLTTDERIVRWLATRGESAAFVPYQEWAR